MQENFSSKSNNNDEQQHIDSEQNEQQSASEQEEQIKDTPQEQPSVPSEGGHLPAWLRAEMGDSSPEPQEEQQSTEQKPEASSAEREVQQLREQVRGYQHQLASVQRQVHRLEESANYQAAPERGGCLTAWLAFMGVGSVLGIAIALVAFSVLGGLSLLLLAGGVLAFIGVTATWQFKKWGYYLLMALYGISIVSSFFSLCVAMSSSGGGAPTSGGSIVGAVLGMLILYLLVREKWSAFE